eukprot:jgi/Botrbrau1/7182/Bobra.0300s0012.1
MLAVFGKQRTPELASPRKKAKTTSGGPATLTPEEEEYVGNQLDNLYKFLPRRNHAYVKEITIGGGANGLGFVEGDRYSVASEGGTTVFCSADFDDLETDSTPADFITNEFKRALDSGMFDGVGDSTAISERLAQIQGPFAIIIHDRKSARIYAARDVQGAEPLFWGTNLVGEGLLFSSDRAMIEGECADADVFPAGSLFVSFPGETTGELTNLTSRVEGKGGEGGPEALCRSASQQSLGGIPRTPSHSHIPAA